MGVLMYNNRKHIKSSKREVDIGIWYNIIITATYNNNDDDNTTASPATATTFTVTTNTLIIMKIIKIITKMESGCELQKWKVAVAIVHLIIYLYTFFSEYIF